MGLGVSSFPKRGWYIYLFMKSRRASHSIWNWNKNKNRNCTTIQNIFWASKKWIFSLYTLYNPNAQSQKDFERSGDSLGRMNPTSSLYSALAYRYGLSIGNSYSAEIFAIIVWSRHVTTFHLYSIRMYHKHLFFHRANGVALAWLPPPTACFSSPSFSATFLSWSTSAAFRSAYRLRTPR